jgi:type III restriction enzyme
VLAILSRTTANTALTQMVGRILRQPHARATGIDALDQCYVYTFDQDVNGAVENVRRGLQSEGMADLASSVKATDGEGEPAAHMRRETIPRREKFRDLPPIFLPRILHCDPHAEDGWREIDYDRDILAELDWAGLQFSGDLTVNQDRQAGPERTVARIDLGPEQPALESSALDVLPEEGLDRPFLVRQLLEVVPNPWQGLRILDEVLEKLRSKGLSDLQIYSLRLDLLLSIKNDLKKQINSMAEQIFRAKLANGDIALKLAASRDSKLNWALAETLEVEVSDHDRPLRRKNGQPLEKSLFETVYQREFNNLEKRSAWYLDEHEMVHWWHRLAVNRRAWSLQGWQRHRVYPDLLACVHAHEDGQYRFSVLETKGEHLKGNDDTEYKRRLFELLTQHMNTAQSVGELTLDGEMRFEMLLEDEVPDRIDKTIVEKAG